MDEPQVIKALFDKLMLEPLQRFPELGQNLIAPSEPGVYVLYGSKGEVRYVGLAHGLKGIRSRLMAHMRADWHTAKYGRAFRRRGGFRCLTVDDARQSALLEAYATGCLCPTYLGNRKEVP